MNAKRQQLHLLSLARRGFQRHWLSTTTPHRKLLQGRPAYPSSFDAKTQLKSDDLRLYVTPLAIQRLQQLNKDYQSKDMLRVAVDSGGCHGFQYKFELIPSTPLKSTEPVEKKEAGKSLSEDDILFEGGENATLVLDAISFPYLAGAVIDYTQELMGSQFVVASNPNASSQCGCKISFQMNDEA